MIFFLVGTLGWTATPMMQGVGQTTSFLGDSAAATAAAARIFAVVDRKPAIDSADEGGQRLPAPKGRIELRCKTTLPEFDCYYC